MNLRAAVVTVLILVPRGTNAQEGAPAQVPPPTNAQTPIQAPATQDPDAQVDVIDVWHRMRHRQAPEQRQEPEGLMIAAAPIIGWNPTFGMTFGAAAQVAFVAGNPEETRLSSSVTSLSYSTKHQTLFNLRFDAFTSENRWFIEGDNRVYVSGQPVYGLGSDTPESAAVDANYTFVRVHDTAYRRVRGPFYVGAGLLFDSHSSVRPATVTEDAWAVSPYVTYSQQHGLPVDSQQSSGITANVLVDRRVGEIDPRRGWMLQAWYRASFLDFLGADSDWQLAHVELRTYVPLSRQPRPSTVSPGGGVPARHRLAIWAFTDLTTSGTPAYFDLPATVSDSYARSSRGYQEGRYRGERLVYGEIEYRGMLTRNGLLGVVGFVNTTTVTNLSAGEKLFDSYAPAAGGGLRVLFNKQSRTNFCIDVAVGKAGATGMYFAIQDAF